VSGAFVALEGVDGVGKSTQAELLRARLAAAGQGVQVVREPGGTALGEAVRELLLARREITIGAEAQMLLFLASRLELWEERIEPALRRGEVVISDRYHLSTIVYQGIAGALGESRAVAVCREVLGDRRPAISIVITLPIARCRERLGGEWDRFESAPGYLERVAEGFATTAGIPGDRIERVSGEGSAEEVADRVEEAVRRVLA
jgi:dTMP kinase